MKFIIRDLKLGDSVNGRVVELLPGGELLISLQGDLLRVANESRRSFKVDDPVTLLVKAILPLKFQLVDERYEQRRKGHLDLSV